MQHLKNSRSKNFERSYWMQRKWRSGRYVDRACDLLWFSLSGGKKPWWTVCGSCKASHTWRRVWVCEPHSPTHPSTVVWSSVYLSLLTIHLVGGTSLSWIESASTGVWGPGCMSMWWQNGMKDYRGISCGGLRALTGLEMALLHSEDPNCIILYGFYMPL